MRKLTTILMAGILLTAAGCTNVVGPLQPHRPERVDDPGLPLAEQQKRGRADLPLPDLSPRIGPPTGQQPGSWGVQQH